MAPTVDTLLSASPPSMAQACPRGKMVIPNKTKAGCHQRLKVSSETTGLGWQLVTTVWCASGYGTGCRKDCRNIKQESR